MASRSALLIAPTLVIVAIALTPPALAQKSTFEPPRLADGQPDLNGIWNNVGSSHIPLELPDEFADRVPSQQEIDELVKARSDRGKSATWQGHENSRGVGAYANYWFDWFWKEPTAIDAPALLIEPANGKMPSMTKKGQQSVDYYRAVSYTHLTLPTKA